jgi:alcohol dehydrogenase class IV
MKKIADNLEEAFSHGDNLDARLNMSLAALLAGMAFGNAGVIAGHAIAHAVEANYNIPHGVSVALTLPYIMEYNAPAVQAKLAKVARVLGETGLGEEEAASSAATRVKSILEKLELPTKLSELNVPKEDLPMMAEELLKAKGYLARNPRSIEYDEAVEIFEKMW